MKRNLHLLVIDPQNDFCDLPPDYLPATTKGASPPVPALPVPGAHADMLRLADAIKRGMAGLTGISVTLDSHHRLDIAHPAFWMDAGLRPVQPFTQVTAADVREGKYLPRDAKALARVLAYLDALEAAGRYRLMVWPTHCEVGSWGHKVHADVRAALNLWEETSPGIVNQVIKGMNPWTEHYSAIEAEVPDADDAGTQTNHAFIDLLAGSDRLYIAGEAGSHCVKATTEHIAAKWDQTQLGRLVLVTDCMSAVTGFHEQHERFVRDMRERGVQIATAADMAADLIDNAKG